MKFKLCMSVFLLAWTLCCSSFAQTAINGRVVDEQSTPMEYVNVLLLNKTDSAFVQGYVTQSDGVFSFDVTSKGVLIKISTIGYITQYIEVTEKELGDIKMQPGTSKLGEVIVKGTRPQYQMSTQGLSVNVKGTMLSEAGTANDIIELLPGIEGSNGKYNVIGKGKTLVYINGRLLYNTSELDRLSSKEIANIELDSNPGAKYAASVGAVIRINTIKKAGDGLSGSERLRVRQGHYTSFNELVNLNYRKNAFDIFGELSHSFNQSYQEQRENDQTFMSDSHWKKLQTTAISNKKNQLSGALGLNVQISKKHSFGLRYNIDNDNLGDKSLWPTNESVYSNGTLVEQNLYENTVRRSMPFSHLVNAYYNGKVGKLSIDFNNDVYFAGKRVQQDVVLSSTDNSKQDINSKDNQRSKMWASKLILSYPMSFGEIEWGYEFTHSIFSNEYKSQQQITPSTDDEIKEQMLAGFLSYRKNIGKKIKFEAGVRYEHVMSDYYAFGKFVDEQSRKYDRLFPNAKVIFPIGNTKITLSYSEKTTRPSYRVLSSSIQYDSKYLLETGNPLLRPTIRHDISLSGVYKWVYASLSYYKNKDYMSSEIVPYEKESPVNLRRFINIDNLSYISANVSLSPKIGKWSPTWSMSVISQDYEIKTIDGVHRLTTPIIQPRWTNFIDLGKQFNLYAAVNGRTAGDSNNTRLKSSWQLSLGLSKKIDGWNLQLRAYDLFRTDRNSRIMYGYSSTFDIWNYSDSQYVQFTVTHSFNSTKSKYKGTGAGNNEKNRLK
ncbi:MAG: outer membrane beta-barrel family protein [Bacteroidales bacterium]|nr:outer membrane beta-barrel family protein [Bacteroidales bacterium]